MAVRISIAMLTVLTPPAVDPGEPPMNMSIMVTAFDAGVKAA